MHQEWKIMALKFLLGEEEAVVTDERFPGVSLGLYRHHGSRSTDTFLGLCSQLSATFTSPPGSPASANNGSRSAKGC